MLRGADGNVYKTRGSGRSTRRRGNNTSRQTPRPPISSIAIAGTHFGTQRTSDYGGVKSSGGTRGTGSYRGASGGGARSGGGRRR